MNLSLTQKITSLAGAALVALAAGCATAPADRVAANQAAFASWPPAIQAEVQAGQAAVGMTPDQVLMALGEPRRRTLVTGPQGTTEYWFYSHHAARLSIGIGGGGYSGHTGVGGAVSADGIKLGHDSSGQVLFVNGRVSQVIVTTN